MRKLIATVGGLIVLLVVAVAASSPAADFITYNERPMTREMIDLGPLGPSIGDSLLVRYHLTTRSGSPLGEAYEICRWASSSTSLCVGLARLPLGSIAYTGRVGDYLAVTGGTREYRGVSGQMSKSGRTVSISIN